MAEHATRLSGTIMELHATACKLLFLRLMNQRQRNAPPTIKTSDISIRFHIYFTLVLKQATIKRYHRYLNKISLKDGNWRLFITGKYKVMSYIKYAIKFITR